MSSELCTQPTRFACFGPQVYLGQAPISTLPPRRVQKSKFLSVCVLAALIACGFGVVTGLRGEQVRDDKPIPQGVPAEVMIRLFCDKPRYYLGENVLLHYEVKNTGQKPIHVETGGDYRGSPRHLRFRVIATDEDGQAMADPTPDPECFGGLGGATTIKPGESFFDCVPVMRYCVFDNPGKYTVRVSHDLGWSEGRERDKIAEGDVRWASTQIELVMPDADQAAQVVATMQRQTNSGGTIGKKREPFADFACLRYPVYLPMVWQLAVTGDVRAFESLAATPTPEATRAIVDSLSHDKPEVVDAAVNALRGRLPHPSLTDDKVRCVWRSDAQRKRQRAVVEQTWRGEFAAPVMAYARKTLALSPSTGMRDQRMESAAFLIESIAPPAELPTITRALDRMLERSKAVAVESPLIYGIIPHLQFAARTILLRGGKAAENPASPGEIAIYLEAVKQAKTQPAALDAYQQKWIVHAIPYVQRLTIESLPTPCPTWAIERLRERVDSPDIAIQYAAVNAIAKTKDASFGPALLQLVRQAEDQWVTQAAGNTAGIVGVPRDQVLLAWAERLERPDRSGHNDFYEAMGELISVIKHQGYGTRNSDGGPLSATERTALKARWVAFVEKNRDAIRNGRQFNHTDSELSTDLIPRNFSVHVDGKEWPALP